MNRCSTLSTFTEIEQHGERCSLNLQFNFNMRTQLITCILKPVNIIKTNSQQHYKNFLPEFSSLAI